ncbi:amine acid ABC transporter, permease protein, 3-TM region, His/Glu/Gln/Arg/opine family [Variovorax sp. CF313]|jgi:glutamate/aspartate transport system permease protein|uniref:amino acid ABC transporter permease n=1 Tax=Variovorax sp. CF313 TaxID=1144315 RepID=UPI0002713DC6|nr:amino acid ABC transporter permease [Variovorax sp. CF313]EJL80013.1 amine acid ABC transporter, permease protein, 3-TM region, His/Glu/Gln/Arg/opine family [Variovorax sp. CF313]
MHYTWDWLIFFKPSVTGEGMYGLMLLRGLLWTVVLSLLAWTLALGIGLFAGVARTLPSRTARYLSTVYIHCFRNTPLLVQLFLWYFVVPELLPVEWGNALKQMNPTTNQFLTVLVGLTLYTAAKAAEQVRAGIESVPRSQKQAAMALGLGTTAAYRHVILPQALRTVIPPLTSDFLNVFKNSAVALTIGLMELTGQTRQFSEFSAHPFEAFIASTLIYVAITYGVIVLMRHVERRTRVPGLLGAA